MCRGRGRGESRRGRRRVGSTEVPSRTRTGGRRSQSGRTSRWASSTGRGPERRLRAGRSRTNRNRNGVGAAQTRRRVGQRRLVSGPIVVAARKGTGRRDARVGTRGDGGLDRRFSLSSRRRSAVGRAGSIAIIATVVTTIDADGRADGRARSRSVGIGGNAARARRGGASKWRPSPFSAVAVHKGRAGSASVRVPTWVRRLWKRWPRRRRHGAGDVCTYVGVEEVVQSRKWEMKVKSWVV